MACFPRLRVFHRTKNSFNPAEDDNIDTILNQQDNPVQIGRYIRREETTLFTPKSSELQKQQQQQAQNDNSLDPQINRSFRSSNNGSGNNNEANNKKFISHKAARNVNRSNSNNYGSITGNNNNANYAQPRLKPVKERRPTALPSDMPKLDADELDSGIASESNDNISIANTPNTPTSMENVKFFIGGTGKDDDAASMAETEVSRNHNSSMATTHTPPAYKSGSVFSKSGSKTSQLSHNDSKSYSYYRQLTNGGEAEVANSLSSSRSNSHVFLPKSSTLKSKYSNASSTSSRTKKPGPPPFLLRPQQDPTPADLNIPTPPPLPPQPLTTASSSASLISMRSLKAHRNSEATSNFNSNSNENSNSKTATNSHAQAVASTTPTTPAPATTTNGNANSLSHDLQMCTIAEVLNISSSTTRTGNSYNNGDSGVEDPYSTPKDSDRSNSLTGPRIDGGIIFTRPNLPAQKNIEIKFIEKDERTRNLIRNAIEKNDFLNNYMDKERKELVINAMSPASYHRGSFIIRENDEGSEIFVSEDGSFDVIKGNEVVGSFGPATVFGELAILYNANRLASVKATSNARVWKIDRVTFRQIMLISESKEREENLSFLRTAPFLNDLNEEVLNRVADLLQRKFYETNACIVREGDIGNEFFIIRGGTVTIKKIMEDGAEHIVDRRKRGDYFGEQALLNADRRLATVYADAPGTEVLKLDREAFISYLGTIPQLREKPGERELDKARPSNRRSEFDPEFAHVQLADLKKIATLGAGAFGRVDLVAYGKKTFALKIIKKIDIVKQDQVEHVYSEKHVMMKCRSSPFIIQLYKTFRNEKFVYFLMEACMGGDVWTIMSQRRFFDEKTARFIAGCVVEAFDFLHSHNIIYRDLKPENLMLTTDGYCKLVDFGFAKHVLRNQKTNTFAGTPEYVAPEIILDRGHDRAVDYWALGILIFELLVGKTPFRGQNQIKIYQQILGGIDVIQMPSKIPKSAQQLIKHLCKQLPAERLGYQRKGILDIKKHSWFDSLDWQKIKNKQLASPIKRPITSNTDLQYFGPPGVDNDQDPPDETSGWDIDF